MPVTFTTCAGTGARCPSCQDTPPAPAVTTHHANAARILRALDYSAPDAPITPGPSAVDAVDFGLRILLARAFTPPSPTYLHERLEQLQILTDHAISYGCLITWHQVAPTSP